MPLVSFCISTYKRGEVLKSTLESIQRQNFNDYEVIISDNDSEENGKDITRSMNDSRFKYFANGENLGMKQSYNKSLERSSGEYIVMMADDDPVYYDMLSTLNNLICAHPGYGMYMGGCDWFSTDSKLSKMYKLNIGNNSCLSNEHDLNYVQTFTADEFLKNFFSFRIFKHYLWSTCMVRRNVLIEKGGVPEYGTPFFGDYAYLSVSASHSGCVVINRPLGCQTLHTQNFGRNQNDQILTVVKNFPPYVAARLNHLPSWKIIEKQMFNFVGQGVVSHLSFLYNYSRELKTKEFDKIEEEIFNVGFMKKYKLKYLLKTRAPILHDQLVLIKKKLNEL